MGFKKIEENSEKRPEGRSCILVSGYGRVAVKLVEELARDIGIPEVLMVPESLLGCSMRTILDGTAEAVAHAGHVPDPFIVFSALSDAELHRFIERFRETSLERPLFAVATPTNASWKLGDLGIELGRERDEIARRQQAGR